MNTIENNTCQYRGPHGETCCDPATHGHLCYWHDDERVKTEPDLVKRLEDRARTGIPMIGFSLRRANLSGIDLINHGAKQGYQLLHSDLYRCNLTGSHLFKVDFTGSSLMKANLNNASLNCATFKNTNLLGIQLDHAKIDNIQWDDITLQERIAYTEEDKLARLEHFNEAEEVYRNLRKLTEAQGLFELTGNFFHREMVMRRYRLPRYSFNRLLSKIVDLFCGYGEAPVRVVIFSIVTIFIFSILFYIFGIHDGNTTIRLSLSKGPLENIQYLLQSIYFSIVTFTTLGYGDLTPQGWTRLFAAIEAFIGSFTLALFVVVFVKKMTR